MSERDATLRYLREQHAALLKRIDHFASPGHGAPGFVEQLQRDARGIEATLQAILCAPVAEEKPPSQEVRFAQAFMAACDSEGTYFGMQPTYEAAAKLLNRSSGNDGPHGT